MSTDNEKPAGSSPEDVSRKLDLIIKRLDALEQLIAKKPEYEGLAIPLRLTKMGLGLYEEPLRFASELKLEDAISTAQVSSAGVQANLVLRAKEVRVGERFTLELEIVNRGVAAVQLTKVETLFPEGFKLVRGPKAYRVEGTHVNLHGKLLEPLNKAEVKLLLRPLAKGIFTFNPKVHYQDEAGSYKTYQPKPVSVTVKDLGISGWIKGPI